jgi:DNA-directed RNA polymerase III subunit RPC1
LSGVKRALVNKNEGKEKDISYNLLAEGVGLKEVMSIPGVDSNETTTNHILEVFEVLGIEAGRQAIINELTHTFKEHGIEVDHRHIGLVADRMTTKGQVLGFTRHGMKKMKDSIILNASFEVTAEHLFNAAAAGFSDQIAGVSESIITGN